MSRHTPGPYIVERCYDGARTVAEMRSCHDLVCVNTIDPVYPRSPLPYEATMVNAHLLAAAPDLLAACEAARALFRDLEGVEIALHAHDEISAVTAVVERALRRAKEGT